jgi:hypothetical protein
MEQNRIDSIARMMARVDSRRRAFGIVLGGAGAALVGRSIATIGAEQRDCRPAGDQCAIDDACCSGRCDDGRCVGQDAVHAAQDADGRAGAGAGGAKAKRRKHEGTGGKRNNNNNKGKGRGRDDADKPPQHEQGHDADPTTEPAGEYPDGDAEPPPEATAAPEPTDEETVPDAEATVEPDVSGDDSRCIAVGKPCKNDARCCSGRCVKRICRKGQEQDVAADGATTRAASAAPGASDRVLLAIYNHRSTSAGVNYAKMAYRPRQFATGLVVADPFKGNLRVDNAGPYAGWDILDTYNYSNNRLQTRNDWLELQLNRRATVAVVWRGGTTIPNWLGGWTKATDITVAGRPFPTYRRVLPAGKTDLGSVFNPGDNPNGRGRDTYWVLFAEADGLASPEPRVPSGRERPRPNQTCPTWVHGQYVTQGPDGKNWPTWHHQIEPVYWCYHRHEHGSNPAAFHASQKPVYGYTTAQHGYAHDLQEAHPGFKTYVVDDDNGNRWMITQHFGTTGLARACQRHHTVDIAVRRRSDGQLLADLHFMADYGKSLVNNTDQPLRPAACPDQANVTGSGTRKLPTQESGYVGYEPWRFDQRGNVLGLTGSFTVNTPDTVAYCNTVRCDRAIQTGNSGSEHFLTPNDGFSLTDPKHAGDGTFYTNDTGSRLLSAGAAGALRQYVRPGMPRLSLRSGGSAGHYRDLEAWGRPYVYTKTDSNPTEREGSIEPPN